MIDIDAVQHHVRQELNLSAQYVRESRLAVDQVIERLTIGDDIDDDLRSAIEMNRMAGMHLHGVVAIRNAMRSAARLGAN